MKTADIFIQDYHYYPDADVFLVRGTSNHTTKKKLPRAVIGWMFRTSPEALIETKSFPDIPAAMTAYESARDSGTFPDKVLDVKDVFQRKVYDWESQYLHPLCDSPVTDRKAARRIIRQISRDMNMPAPRLIWADESSDSEYDEEDHVVTFGHRHLIPLLHELAHATHSRVLDEKDNENAMHHSPGFVWHAIDLYHRYAGIDLDFLVQSAARMGILGPIYVREPEYYIQNCKNALTLSGPFPG